MATGVVERIAADVLALDRAWTLVAVDGVDGSGKTVFADRLARAVAALGGRAVRVSEDDYHHPREVRWRQGRSSPQGFFEDSYDLDRLESLVLQPFRDEGRYVPRVHDVATDDQIAPEWHAVEPPAVLVADGLFLHRDELVERWDRSMFLDVPFHESVRRMAERDGTHPDPDHPSMQRYVEGQRLYFRTCSPDQRATWVVDNTDFRRPRILRAPPSERP